MWSRLAFIESSRDNVTRRGVGRTMFWEAHPVRRLEERSAFYRRQLSSGNYQYPVVRLAVPAIICQSRGRSRRIQMIVRVNVTFRTRTIILFTKIIIDIRVRVTQKKRTFVF